MKYHEYFTNALNFFNGIYLYILLSFVGIVLIEFIVLKCLKKSTDTFFIFVMSDLLIYLAIHMMVFVVWGSINYFKDTFMDTWHTFLKIMSYVSTWGFIGVAIIAVICGLVWGWEGAVGALIGVPIAAGILSFVLFGLWLVLKALFFASVGMFYSTIDFFTAYWKEVTIIVATPAVLYGLWIASSNYFHSVKDGFSLSK